MGWCDRGVEVRPGVLLCLLRYGKGGFCLIGKLYPGVWSPVFLVFTGIICLMGFYISERGEV